MVDEVDGIIDFNGTTFCPPPLEILALGIREEIRKYLQSEKCQKSTNLYFDSKCEIDKPKLIDGQFVMMCEWLPPVYGHLFNLYVGSESICLQWFGENPSDMAWSITDPTSLDGLHRQLTFLFTEQAKSFEKPDDNSRCSTQKTLF